jgi:serine/threonine-protein kinase
LEEIIMKVLSKEPSARYRTADQLGRVLLKFGMKRDEPVAPALNLTPEVATRFETRQTPARPQPQPVRYAEPEPEPELESTAPEIDWTLVGLGLGALIAVGGLIPFWMYIWFLYNPPVR